MWFGRHSKGGPATAQLKVRHSSSFSPERRKVLLPCSRWCLSLPKGGEEGSNFCSSSSSFQPPLLPLHPRGTVLLNEVEGQGKGGRRRIISVVGGGCRVKFKMFCSSFYLSFFLLVFPAQFEFKGVLVPVYFFWGGTVLDPMYFC